MNSQAQMLPPTFIRGFHNEGSNSALQYARLGNTDMVVSNLSLGGSAFGNCFSSMLEEDINAIVKTALKAGINYIDTAPWYGQGLSEKRLGMALKDLPRKAYYIATKVESCWSLFYARLDFCTQWSDYPPMALGSLKCSKSARNTE